MRVSPFVLLLAGLAVPFACGGTAIVDPADDDGGGGSGATTTTSGPTTSSSMGGAPSTTSTSVGPGPGPGPSTSSGTTMCIGCGDYIVGDGDLADLCGITAINRQDGTFSCNPDTSCEYLSELQECTCSQCAGDCEDACLGGEIGPNCFDCITGDCANELNQCAGDVQ